MLIWIATIILVISAVGGWLFLKQDPEKYIHEQSAPINIFFKWGRLWHHIFKVAIIMLSMFALFFLYRYALSASYAISLFAAVTGGVVLSGGKELLDKAITIDDVAASILAILIGYLALILLF